MPDKILTQLGKMKRSELRKMCEEFTPPIPWKNHWTVKKLASGIRTRQLTDAANAEPEPSAEPVEKPIEPKPEFEQACTEPVIEQQSEKGSGGVRPGAGRPEGVTDELANRRRALNLAQADPNITILVQGAYAMLYGDALNEHPELVPTDEEADLVALPATKIIEYHFPGLTEGIVMAYFSIFTGFLMLKKTQREKIVKAGLLEAPKPKPQEGGNAES